MEGGRKEGESRNIRSKGRIMEVRGSERCIQDT